MQTSVIIVNYNRLALTRRLINNLYGQKKAHNCEMLVVDNSSREEERITPGANDHFRVIITRNQGYAAAINEGIRQANGSILILLNNDLLFPEGMFACLLEEFLQQDTCAAMSPVIQVEESGRIEFAGYTEINPLTGRNRAITRQTGEQFSSTSYLHGACMIATREIWSRTGGLPEIYFLYYEEMEWSVKIRASGACIGVLNRCQVFHKAPAEASEVISRYYLWRNRLLFQRRNTRRWQYLIFLAYFIGIATPVKLVLNLVRGRTTAAADLLRAISWNLNNAPENETV